MNTLYIVPTPIGNLDDITLRAIKVLQDVDFVIAEDTRTSGNLLRHLQISKPLFSYHKFNEHQVVSRLIEKIQKGEKAALISDAGTPGISDPGFLIIREAIKTGISIECLPGPTALIPALVMSGLPCDRFCFEGFLPQKKGRQKRLSELKEEQRTMIFYESPMRLLKTLEQLSEFFGGQRRASISREISKIHQETLRGTIEELIVHLKGRNIKGEIVICVEGQND
ncbi:MAG: 16S rRNA (cytidine(1402)-2'-O)-methyltransferase [Bacteroidales bacterium]|nr:16S rRNA (cytidine(1402)-2'-O)-methyltransferase [Bacteroidales bacterium]